MEKPQNKERIVMIYQMLFEMARGNFNSRIPLSSNDDELEALVVLINMVAEEMKESIFHAGYINRHRSHEFMTQTTFLLDENLHLISFTPEVSCFLGFEAIELLNMPLSNLINKNSLEKIQKVLIEGITQPTIITLDFITKNDLLISVTCSIGKLIHRSEIVLNLVTPVRQDAYNPMAYENEKHIKAKKFDALLIQKLYDYILAHLEEPLPSLKELARQFGTNEHKLKDGFRYFFKTSIYQFYNDERLKRAYFMIEHTAIPLKNISIMNGFNNYPNFSKSFKKRFGFSPYELKRTPDTSISLEDN